MNLFRKTTATVALVTLVSGIFSAWVSASSNEIESANALAAAGYINDNSDNTAAYNLNQNVLRQEIAAVARGIAGLDKKASCDNSFSDVSSTNPNNWACSSVEALLDAGLISANAKFNPESNISKAESIGMMVKASFGDEYSYDSSSDNSWQEQVVWFAVSKGIVSNFTNYDDSATRGFVFEVANNAMVASEEVVEACDEVSQLLGLCDEDTTTDTTTDTTSEDTTDTVVVSGSNSLTVSLSPDTPAASTIPADVNGIPVAKFDFTAWSEDLTVTQITLTRRGLSDKDTIESLAIFTDEGRASNEKNDNQENDTEAQITLTNGWVVIKAWETRTLSIIADVANANTASQDEFALEVTEVVASTTVEELTNVVSNTMRIGSVDAPVLTFDKGGSVSNPKIGEENTDIFEFEIEWDNDEDVILKTITFEGSSDAEDDLSNFELYFGNEMVSSTTSIVDDYLTFDLGEGLIIEEDKIEDFTVRADVVEWASDTIEFRIDQSLDVTALSTKFGYGSSIDVATNNVNTFGTLWTITIEAWELTLVELEPAYDEIREGKDNVELGSIKVTNVAGQNLELQEFGIRIALTQGNAKLPGNNTGTLTVNEMFQDIEIYSEETGSSYELTLNGTDDADAVFSENSIDVILPQGTTTWTIRADTADEIVDFDTASFVISFTTGTISNTTGWFYVEETQDDKEVTDITPSSVTFNTIDGSESSADLSEVSLADVTVVRGVNDIVALQFEVEADQTSPINIDEMTVLIADGSSDNKASNNEVSDVKLYKGSVSLSNLLDQESGSQLASWQATFDRFEIDIPANWKETFIVTVSFVDSADAVSASDYTVSLVSLDIQDDENDDVTPTPVATSIVSNRQITVKGFGVVTLSEDSNNQANEDAKTILAGTSQEVFSLDTQSINESMDVEEVFFTLSGATFADIDDSLVNATLWLNDQLIETNTNSDIYAATSTGTTIVRFDDLTNLTVGEQDSELRLVLNTDTIGYQKNGKTLTGLTVTYVSLKKNTGIDSGKDAADTNLAISTSAKTFDIVPAVVNPSVLTSLASSATPELSINIDLGGNTKNESNSTSNVVLTQVVLSTLGSNIDAASSGAVFALSNLDDSNDTVTGSIVGSTITFDLTGLATNNATVSDSIAETFKISVTGLSAGNNPDTLSLKLLEDGITYNVKDSNGDATNADSTGLTTNLATELDMGSRQY